MNVDEFFDVFVVRSIETSESNRIESNRRDAAASHCLSVLIRWSMTPRTVNAYYSPSLNEIVFPAGILQPPFFHKDLPLTINYGSIGSVCHSKEKKTKEKFRFSYFTKIIGHEMTHGFDNQGREFDADGNMRSWWTNQCVEKYKDKSQCFIDQYSNYSIDGVRTLGENIADNGGMKIAFRAYRKHQKERNVQLPGLNYTSDQLFFIAFAHVRRMDRFALFFFAYFSRAGAASKQKKLNVLI